MPRFFILTSIFTFFFTCLTFTVQAQDFQPYSPWQEEEEINNRSRLPDSTTSTTTTQAIEKEPIEEPLSALEAAYEQRLTDTPKQFGYDLFQTHGKDNGNTPMGAMQDNFVLGTGDNLQIAFTGQRTDHGTYKIDTHGMLLIKDMPPISAAGRTIEDLRNAINAQLSAMHNTQAYISLAEVRQIGVLVIGNIKQPGRKNLNAFHTILDALIESGGITKDGSLRRVKLVRGGHNKIIDLYDLLMNGAPHIDLRLKDGDRIIVPPIGPTVAVSGAVKRPGIYEIRQHPATRQSERLSLDAVMKFAGGILTSGEHRFIRMTLTPDGQEIISEVDNPTAPLFGNSTILSVLTSNGKRQGTVKLVGHTRTAGLHDLSQNKTLSELLSGDHKIGDDIYPLIGIIERWNEEQLTTRLISFPLRLVLKSEFNIKMQDNDTVKLFSYKDIRALMKDENNDTYNIENKDVPTEKTAENIINDPTLKSFLKERSAFVRGAVRTPGLYPVAEGITLDNVLAAAGGLTLEANPESIEITSKNLGTNHQSNGKSGTQRTTINLNTDNPRTIEISSGDAVRVNQKFRKLDNKTVEIIGEVLHPGRYDLLAGDRLSDLIARAGGLTEQSYPAGTVFSRESERKTEERRYRNAAFDMERRLAAAIERKDNPPDAKQIAMARDLANELATVEALGRVTVEANPNILENRPELDILLEKGDRIYIPKRQITVRVSGEVLSPASLQFRKDKDPRDYIYEAGGFTYHADKNRAFVLYPDGSAQPLKVNSWNHSPIFIPPGSTIVVPQDPKPFDFIEGAKEIGQILSNLAITAVFIDDIRD